MKSFKEFIKESENLTEQGFVSQQVSRARALPYGTEDDTFRQMPRGFGAQVVGGLTGEIGAKDLITHEFSKKIPEQVKDQIMFLNQARQAIDRTVQSYKSMLESGVPEELMFVEKVPGLTKYGNYYIPYKLPQGTEIAFHPSGLANEGRTAIMLFGLNQFLWNPKTRNVSAIQEKIFVPLEDKEHKLATNPAIRFINELDPKTGKEKLITNKKTGKKEPKTIDLFPHKHHRMMFYVNVDEFNRVSTEITEVLESLETKQRLAQFALKGAAGFGKGIIDKMVASGGYQASNL